MGQEESAIDLKAAADTSGMSRREMLTAAGVVAAGVATAATASPAAATEDDEAGRVGVAKPGVNAAEFRCWVIQSGPSGENFTGFGFLTKLAGADDVLFASEPHDASTALLTMYAEGALERRSFGANVHILDVVGLLTIYQRSAPGASPDDPGSFAIGEPVARFAMTLQDVLAVFAPGRGLPTLTGDLSQTEAGRVDLAAKQGGARFGRRGMRARLSATGLAERPNPATFDTRTELGGNWTIES